MSLVSTAILNPGTLALLPSRMLGAAACAFWLTNPLLLAAYPDLVAERTEQYPGWRAALQRGLATRLASCRGKLSATTPTTGETLPQAELLAVLLAYSEAMDEDEHKAARYLAFTCHARERLWLAEHFRTVLQARLVVLHRDDEAAYAA